MRLTAGKDIDLDEKLVAVVEEVVASGEQPVAVGISRRSRFWRSLLYPT
jgi:hypothetical protein